MPAVNPVWPAALCAEPGARSRAAFPFAEKEPASVCILSRRAARLPGNGSPELCALSSVLPKCRLSNTCAQPPRIHIHSSALRAPRPQQSENKMEKAWHFQIKYLPRAPQSPTEWNQMVGKRPLPRGVPRPTPRSPTTRPPNPRAGIAPARQSFQRKNGQFKQENPTSKASV